MTIARGGDPASVRQFQCRLVDETRPTVKHHALRQPGEFDVHPRHEGVPLMPHARHHDAAVYFDDLGPDTEDLCLTDSVGGARGRDQELRRHASDGCAGRTGEAIVDEKGSGAGAARAPLGRHTGGSGSDDRDVALEPGQNRTQPGGVKLGFDGGVEPRRARAVSRHELDRGDANRRRDDGEQHGAFRQGCDR